MDDPAGGVAPPPDGGEGSETASSGHGVVSFLTSLRGLVSTFAALVIAVGGLITALNQVGVLDGDGGAETETNQSGSDLFTAVTRPNGRVYFDGEVMYVRASIPGEPFLHLADGDERLADISMETRVEYVSGADDYAFGLVCRYRSAANYYLLSIFSGGRYHVVRYRDGRAVSLTGGIQEGAPIREGANEVYAKCVGGSPTTLTLSVNGQAVATVADRDGIESGIFGIRTGSGESFVTMKLDGFELRLL
jgi:hypothetical protein